MKNHPLPRLDEAPELREALIPHCRLRAGQIWQDPQGRHRIGCLDATSEDDISHLTQGLPASLAIHDPPYNIVAFESRNIADYIAWCRKWVKNTLSALSKDSSLYVWLGADQKNGFQPLPDFMLMMRDFDLKSRSFITVRNQRGYGTQKNWMAVRQELLYYTIGTPVFNVDAEYTDIPKILRGYYKEVNGNRTENLERGRSENIRAGNVWVDIQQVFYRMEENVNGCYAQKPIKSIERIVRASSQPNDIVLDCFGHSGTTMLAAELCERRSFTCDIDPVYCEIAIRRLELYRKSGRLGWHNSHPFITEQADDPAVSDVWGEPSGSPYCQPLFSKR